MSLGDIGREMTHVDTLPQGEAVQSIFNVQTHKRDWAQASLSHCEFVLPGTSISASRRRPRDNAGTTTTESVVQTIAGDSGTANEHMMEVEEETSVTDLGGNLHLPSTVGMDYTNTQDMEAEEAGSGGDMLGFGRTSLINTTDPPSPLTIDWASLGQSEFDLPGTSVSVNRSRPDTQLVINNDTLGRGEIVMPGDDADLAINATAPKANRKRKKKASKRNRLAHPPIFAKTRPSPITLQTP